MLKLISVKLASSIEDWYFVLGYAYIEKAYQVSSGKEMQKNRKNRWYEKYTAKKNKMDLMWSFSFLMENTEWFSIGSTLQSECPSSMPIPLLSSCMTFGGRKSGSSSIKWGLLMPTSIGFSCLNDTSQMPFWVPQQIQHLSIIFYPALIFFIT